MTVVPQERFPTSPTGSVNEHWQNVSDSLCVSTGAFALPSAVNIDRQARPDNSPSTGYFYVDNDVFNYRCFRPFGKADTGTATYYIVSVRPKKLADGTYSFVHVPLAKLEVTFGAAAGSPPDFSDCYYATAIVKTSYGPSEDLVLVAGDAAKYAVIETMGSPKLLVHMDLGTATHLGCEYGAGL
jgi:hypothetical protein